MLTSPLKSAVLSTCVFEEEVESDEDLGGAMFIAHAFTYLLFADALYEVVEGSLASGKFEEIATMSDLVLISSVLQVNWVARDPLRREKELLLEADAQGYRLPPSIHLTSNPASTSSLNQSLSTQALFVDAKLRSR